MIEPFDASGLAHVVAASPLVETAPLGGPRMKLAIRGDLLDFTGTPGWADIGLAGVRWRPDHWLLVGDDGRVRVTDFGLALPCCATLRPSVLKTKGQAAGSFSASIAETSAAAESATAVATKAAAIVNPPITDARMTRFWITLEQGAALMLPAPPEPTFEDALAGEPEPDLDETIVEGVVVGEPSDREIALVQRGGRCDAARWRAMFFSASLANRASSPIFRTDSPQQDSSLPMIPIMGGAGMVKGAGIAANAGRAAAISKVPSGC